MGEYYEYKDQTYTCKHCGWTGPGSETKSGDSFRDGYEINCPKCNEYLDFIVYPLIKDMLKYGPEEDKATAMAVLSFQDKWQASLLKDISQLPDLSDDLMAFVLTEFDENGERYIAVSNEGREIWREIRAYEYFPRFIDLGKLLKQKYGAHMVDLVPHISTCDLYGDDFLGPDRVLAFRRSLRDGEN
jgi:hypothetical protein